MAGAEQHEAATAERIATMFLPCSDAWSLRRVGGGLSGAAVFACQADQGTFALKRWPAGTAAARVDEVHEVMLQSRKCLSLVPQLVRSPLGATRLSWGAHHYELTAWMPGEPFRDDHRSDPSALLRPGREFPTMLAAVEAGAEAIARFHDSVQCWGRTCAPAPAILRRLGRIEQLQAELPRALAAGVTLSPTLRTAADWLRCEGVRGLNLASGILGRWTGEITPTQIVLRDIHREHILFCDSRVSGLIDFDAIGRDTVATDLARWVSDFLEPALDRRAIWDAVEAGYSRVLAISPCERELAGAISEASNIILLANWVVWVALGQRDFSACIDLVDRRVSELMRRMVPDVTVTDLNGQR